MQAACGLRAAALGAAGRRLGGGVARGAAALPSPRGAARPGRARGLLRISGRRPALPARWYTAALHAGQVRQARSSCRAAWRGARLASHLRGGPKAAGMEARVGSRDLQEGTRAEGVRLLRLPQQWRQEWAAGTSRRVRVLKEYDCFGCLGKDKEGLPVFVTRHSQGDER